MIELNIKFHEKYKRLDALCKDIFSSKDGVTQYISEMEYTELKYSRLIYNWDDIYHQLKHLRWVRNQLAHEVGAFDCDLCSEDDIKWLDDFYNAIVQSIDPLAKVGNIKRQQKTQQRSSKTQDTATAQSNSTTNAPKENKPSLLDRIKAKLKKWFC